MESKRLGSLRSNGSSRTGRRCKHLRRNRWIREKCICIENDGIFRHCKSLTGIVYAMNLFIWFPAPRWTRHKRWHEHIHISFVFSCQMPTLNSCRTGHDLSRQMQRHTSTQRSLELKATRPGFRLGNSKSECLVERRTKHARCAVQEKGRGNIGLFLPACSLAMLLHALLQARGQSRFHNK